MRRRERSGKVIRNAVDKIVWVGKGAAFLVGLAVILAAVFAVLGAGGRPSLYGGSYRADPTSQLALRSATPRGYGVRRR